MKIIFLDIDGVLNGYSRFTGLCYKVFSKLHLLKFVKRHYDLFGVRTHKVKLLSKIVKKIGAKVVISSSWRGGWFQPYDKKEGRQKELHDKLEKYNITVIGITPRLSSGERGLEIKQWLEEYNDIVDSFVILDDEKFDIEQYYQKELVLTSRDGNITGAWYENTGLKRKHIKQAVNILNKIS